MARPDGATLGLALALIAGASLSAHRRDEHLQASRIGVELDRVDVELDITPGIDVADALVSTIDGDHDGVLSEPERDAFARHAIDGLSLVIDSQGQNPRLVSASFPEVASLRRGEGTIRVKGRSTLGEQNTGGHHLRFANAIALSRSAYLANALVPDSPRVMVTAQHRSVDQRDITIDYTVADDPRGAWAAALVWSVAAALVAFPLALRLFRDRARSARA